MQKASKTTVLLLTAGCFLAFFVFGYTDNLKGPTLPAVLAEIQVGYGVGGNIFFGQYLGFLIATLVTGILADRFGLKTIILLAGFFLVLGVGGYSLFSSPWLLSGALFTIGLGLGALELGPNAIIVSLHPQRKGLFLNLMSVLHGMGSMLAPLVAGALLAGGTSWRSVYRWDLLLVAAFVLYFLLVRFPRAHGDEFGHITLQDIPRFAVRGKLPWFYLSIGLYVAVEVGIAAWLVTFLQQGRGASITASNQALSIFFGTLMLGRLLGGFVVHRVGYVRSVLLASLGIIACISLGLLGPPALAIFLPLTGFFCSIIFPTLTAAVSDAHLEHGNTILGMLFSCAGIGGLVGPWLVGWGSDLFGLQAGFSINLGLAVLLAGSLAILNKGKSYETQIA
jgi:fucose permease